MSLFFLRTRYQTLIQKEQSLYCLQQIMDGFHIIMPWCCCRWKQENNAENHAATDDDDKDGVTPSNDSTMEKDKHETTA